VPRDLQRHHWLDKKTTNEGPRTYIWPWVDKEEGDAKKPTWKIRPLHHIWVEADNRRLAWTIEHTGTKNDK